MLQNPSTPKTPTITITHKGSTHTVSGSSGDSNTNINRSSVTNSNKNKNSQDAVPRTISTNPTTNASSSSSSPSSPSSRVNNTNTSTNTNGNNSVFVKRVSFDNYNPPDTPAAVTGNSVTATNSTVTTPILKTGSQPHSPTRRRDQKSPLTLIAPSSSGDPSSAAAAASPTTSSPPLSHSTNTHPVALSPSISPTASSFSSFISSSPNSKTFNNTASNAFTNNYTLQPSNNNINNTFRKKSYSEMSDSELLALDSQFSVRSIDIQKSYGFPINSRLSSPTFSNSDKNTLNSDFTLNSFKNLSPNALDHEYPTKPIITKNSICYNFKHSNLLNSDLNDKFYLILLSNKSSSLSSLDYYINKISSKGDTIVICCSLSTSILGNNKNESLDIFINSFTSLILSFLESNLLNPINITFEFFKSGTFFNEVLNLYQPSLIIVGTNNPKTKSTSITTPNRKLLSVVYAGNDINNHNNQTNSQMNFKIPNCGSTIVKNNSNSSIDSTDSTCYKLSKMKTNDTINSSLFDNLNNTPPLELSKTTTNSTTYSNDYLKPEIVGISSSSSNQRRRSMLDVLNSDTKDSLSKYPSNEDCAIDDDDDDNNNNSNILIPNNRTNNGLKKTPSRGSSGSFETPLIKPKKLSDAEKQKQELFERYQRRLSAVKVGPQGNVSESNESNTKSSKTSQSASASSSTSSASSSTPQSKGIFKKWFK